MSCWVYIDGTINVSVPGRTDNQRDFVVKDIIDNLPVVNGSEGNLEYYIITPKGYKYSSFYNKYGVHTKYSINTQPDRIIVVHGALRDAYYNVSLKEMVKALSRLSRYLIVNDCLVTLNESWTGKEYIFTNKNEWMWNCFNEDALKNKLLDVFSYYNK